MVASFDDAMTNGPEVILISTESPPALEGTGPQSEVLDFLGQPGSYGAGVSRVERLETHGAYIFLAGDEVFKIKRAVRYPYLDFSTLEKRAWTCRRELALNRRTAPALYIGVVAVVRQADGSLAIGDDSDGGGDDDRGEVLEWAVKMRRFPQEALFDHMARQGKLSFSLCRRLAQKIAAFHLSVAPPRRSLLADRPDPEQESRQDGQHRVAAGNITALRGRPDLFAPATVAALEQALAEQFRILDPLLAQRRAEGFQRHCHGDLHLRNICLFDGEPVLFDCLEFDDDLATVDVLYDLAFLLMDLEQHGRLREANVVLNHYLEITGEAGGLACLPLFLAQRAAVRAKVAGDTEALTEAPDRKAVLASEAADYLQAALTYATPGAPVLVCVGGLSGSGKTRLARALAPTLGAAPGAVHLRSDQIRKALHGQAENQRLAPEYYLPAVSERVYQTMLERAEQILRAGRSVILDAVLNRPADRAAAAALAETVAVAFQGLWLDAPGTLLSARVTARRDDASDATSEVVRQQLKQDTGAIAWPRIDAAQEANRVTVAALEALIASGLTEIKLIDEQNV